MMGFQHLPILAVDPGRLKCGLALLELQRVVLKEVVSRTETVNRIVELLPSNGPIIVGDRTGSKEFIEELLAAIPHISNRVEPTDEHLSSVQARQRYWLEHPPQGWHRLVPVSLQVPPVPIDDYVAVILAERYLAKMLGN